MTHKEKALEYFGDKFHCSQSVIAAFADECGLTEEKALNYFSQYINGLQYLTNFFIDPLKSLAFSLFVCLLCIC